MIILIVDDNDRPLEIIYNIGVGAKRFRGSAAKRFPHRFMAHAWRVGAHCFEKACYCLACKSLMVIMEFFMTV